MIFDNLIGVAAIQFDAWWIYDGHNTYRIQYNSIHLSFYMEMKQQTEEREGDWVSILITCFIIKYRSYFQVLP